MSDIRDDERPYGADEFFNSDEHPYAQHQDGYLEDKKYEGTEYELNKLIAASIQVNTNPLPIVNMYQLLNDIVPLKGAYNTVLEYHLLDGKEISEEEMRELHKNWLLTNTDPASSGVAKLTRHATLCKYAGFVVKGKVTDQFNDFFWVQRLGAFLKKGIEAGVLRNWVLAVGRLDMSLWDPINATSVVLNREATKWTPGDTSVLKPVQNLLDRWVVKGKDLFGKERTYSKADIEKFEKKAMYYLYFFFNEEGDQQFDKWCTDRYPPMKRVPYPDGRGSYPKETGEPPLLPMPLKGLRVGQDLVSGAPEGWSVYEGELPSVVYDIQEQRDYEAQEFRRKFIAPSAEYLILPDNAKIEFVETGKQEPGKE